MKLVVCYQISFSVIFYVVHKFCTICCCSVFGFSGCYLRYLITCCSKEIEEAREALNVQSASVEQLQGQLKEIQEQLNDEEKAREHARMLQR